MSRLLCSLSLALVACGSSKPAPSPIANATPTAPAGAPIYDALFQPGAHWTFAVETKTTPPADMGEPTTEKKPDVTCTVKAAGPVANGRRAEITCAGDQLGANPPNGRFYATDTGLWWYSPSRDVSPEIDAARGLPAKEMLIAHPPAAHETEIKDSENEGAFELYQAKADTAGTWCVGFTSVAGDEGGWQLCLSATGIERGSVFQAGATTVETTYRRK